MDLEKLESVHAYMQVNGVRTKDLDCCQVVPLIDQATGREAHLVISRNPLVWSGDVTFVPHCPAPAAFAPAAGPSPPPCRQVPASVHHACPPLDDGDRGIAR